MVSSVDDDLWNDLRKIDAIDQPYQAFALVGYYLTIFAQLEAGLDHLVGKLLRLDWPQQRIVTANMEFADKVRTARALFSNVSDDVEVLKRGDKLLAELLNKHAPRRNELAHAMVVGNNTDGGALLPTFRARSKVKSGTVLLTIDEAFYQIASMFDAYDRLTEMADSASLGRAQLEAIALSESIKIRM